MDGCQSGRLRYGIWSNKSGENACPPPLALHLTNDDDAQDSKPEL